MLKNTFRAIYLLYVYFNYVCASFFLHATQQYKIQIHVCKSTN